MRSDRTRSFVCINCTLYLPGANPSSAQGTEPHVPSYARPMPCVGAYSAPRRYSTWLMPGSSAAADQLRRSRATAARQRQGGGNRSAEQDAHHADAPGLRFTGTSHSLVAARVPGPNAHTRSRPSPPRRGTTAQTR